MKATLCNFCQGIIGELTEYHRILVDFPDSCNATDAEILSYVNGNALDCCETCYQGQVILSEQRRTRTRRKKAGKGRKARTTVTPEGTRPVNVVTGELLSPTDAAHEAAKVRLHKAAVEQGKAVTV